MRLLLSKLTPRAQLKGKHAPKLPVRHFLGPAVFSFRGPGCTFGVASKEANRTSPCGTLDDQGVGPREVQAAAHALAPGHPATFGRGGPLGNSEFAANDFCHGDGRSTPWNLRFATYVPG